MATAKSAYESLPTTLISEGEDTPNLRFDVKAQVHLDNKDEKFVSVGDLGTFANVTKAFVGAASFELPWAYMQAGLAGSITGVVVLAVMSHFSLSRLAKCNELMGKLSTYPEIGKKAYGTPGKVITWFGIIAMTIGVCGSYVVFISKTLASLVPGTEQWQWVLIVLGPIILLSWLRTYSHLVYTSTFGIFALIMALVVTFVDCGLHHTPAPLSEYPSVRIDSYPLFLGNAAFLYLISSAILPIERSMTKPQNFSKILGYSIALVTIVNLTFGLIAYVFYGDCSGKDSDNADACTQSNVIDNLKHGPLATAVKLALSIDLLFTTIVFLLPISEALEHELFDRTNFGTFSTEVKRNALRTVACVLIALIAWAIPFFALLTGLTGGFGNNILGLILPPIFYLKLKSQQQDKRRGVLHESKWEEEDSLSDPSAEAVVKPIEYFCGLELTKERLEFLKLAEVSVCIFISIFGVLFLGLSVYFFGSAIAKQK
mmetsp:Transcript_15246/g.23085  ORF Transcript_15246/g.23085 Transcript_15246/m.23085 type:complete len:486 (+) Transcript_15246:33-1490(+)